MDVSVGAENFLPFILINVYLQRAENFLPLHLFIQQIVFECCLVEGIFPA